MSPYVKYSMICRKSGVPRNRQHLGIVLVSLGAELAGGQRGDPAGSREGGMGKKKTWVQDVLLSRSLLWATKEPLEWFSEATL